MLLLMHDVRQDWPPKADHAPAVLKHSAILALPCKKDYVTMGRTGYKVQLLSPACGIQEVAAVHKYMPAAYTEPFAWFLAAVPIQ